MKEIRGNTRVTTDRPESTYEALTKYGQDLVSQAEKGKLDPVIGRDTEIRNVIRILSRKTLFLLVNLVLVKQLLLKVLQ